MFRQKLSTTLVCDKIVFDHFSFNKTVLQPVSRPVEQIVRFFPKDLKKVQKMVQTLKTLFYKVRRLRHRQTCYQTSGNITGQKRKKNFGKTIG